MKMFKILRNAAIIAVPVLLHALSNDNKERTLPSPIREELAYAGIDESRIYNGTISDQELIDKGFDPIELNHWIYSKNHPKYRRR